MGGLSTLLFLPAAPLKAALAGGRWQVAVGTMDRVEVRGARARSLSWPGSSSDHPAVISLGDLS